MKKHIWIKIIVSSFMAYLLILVGGAVPAHAAPPAAFERTELVTGLNQPTAFRQMPDGRIFIAEKSGAIKVYQDNQLDPQPLITLLVLQSDTNEERGLLGIEPDPNFATNGYLYVAYTSAGNHDRLSRITVTGNTADPASEVVLLESTQAGNIFHHGGEVRFGPDGKLYWGMGMNTDNTNSQNLTNVHGKIMRLNTDGSAPADNPFLTTPNAVPQIWAYGLRNPFRFTFTPNNKLLAADVGGDKWEELDIVTRGGNYGWPLAEGNCASCAFVNPIYSYAHTAPPEKAGSITGVMVYTGNTFPASYKNKVFIADYTLGFIRDLTFDSDYSTFISEETFDANAGTVVQLEQGQDGNIYQLNIYPGTLSKISPSGGNRAPVAAITATPSNGLAPLPVSFSSSGSSDPDGNTLTYAWDFGDGTTSTAPNPQKTYTTTGTYNATLTVSDGTKTNQAVQKITVGSTAPTATILSPTDQSKYNAGDTINFSGSGTDAEDATLPDSAFTWKVVFHHGTHTHPFRDNITGKTGSIQIPRSADNISTTWYRIELTVTDSSGLATTKTIDIYPNLVNLTFNANYPDATYTVDGIPHQGVLTESAVVGVERAVGATSPQYTADSQYIYNNWSDGGAQSHTIVTPAQDATFTLNYNKSSVPPSPWEAGDIGHITVPGYTSYDNGIFTVRGSGGDIWATVDEMQFVHQPVGGDSEVTARVTSQTNTNEWAKAGVMFKESTISGSKYVMLAVTPSHGIRFQYNFNGESGSADYTFPNGWLKLTRTGNTFKGYSSTDGNAWTLVGQVTLNDMPANMLGGLVVNSHQYDALNTSVFDNVSVKTNQEWTNQDIGAPAITGSTSITNGLYTIKGAGNDIWGTDDQFQYNYQSLPADGEITARVTSFTNTGGSDGWAKAGVIIKQSTTAGSPYALLAITPSHSTTFQSGFNQSVSSPNSYVYPNVWLKIKRTGNVITSYSSSDGQTWAQVGSTNVTLTGTPLIGLFVGSHNGAQASTATFDNVTITRTTADPIVAPWSQTDIGNPQLAGSGSYANGTFTIRGGGNDIWQTADQSHYVSQTLPSNGEIIARVKSQSNSDSWAKSGIMIKDSTVAGSNYALLAVTPGHGTTFQYNYTHDTAATQNAAAPPNAWLKLTRVRDIITAYTSLDGQVWTQVGSASISFGANIKIGMVVVSHNGSVLNESVFDNVTVTNYSV